MPESCILEWHILLVLTQMYPTWLVYSSIEGYPDLFRFSATMNPAAVHNCILA